jgi:Peptidyl-prolyl cis-trans isomerase (rotamase) - cyclophilin family
MKRYLTLAVLVLLAASCGGRHGKQDGDGAAADSLATETAQKPEGKSRAAKTTAKADTVSLTNYKNRLPQEPIFDIVTSMGTIRVKLYKDTPKHRDNFTKLALSHFYDDVLFHRVIDGFIIQGGDPFTRDTSRVEEWGEGGPGYTIDAEIVPKHRHLRGALAAARRGNLANPMKESSGSQFYLVQDSTNCKHLNGEYTVFGETIGGLNVIDRIARVQTDRLDRPVRPVVIRRIRPNDQLNKRALEEEQRAQEMGLNPFLEESAPSKEPDIIEEEPTAEVQPQADTAAPRRRVKHRITTKKP